MKIEFYFNAPKPRTIRRFFLLVLFFGNVFGIVFLWLINSKYYIQNPDGGNIFVALGRLTGLLGEFFLLMQLVLIGRIRSIEHLFGFDKLNRLHRWIGYSILILLLGHPLLLVIGNAWLNGVPFISQFADFLANKENVLLAFFGLLIFMLIVFLSIPIVRHKLRYEAWYFIHLLTYVGIGLALSHQLGTGDLREGAALYYWYILNFSVFGFILLYRFVRPIYLTLRFQFRVEKVVQENADTWSLYVAGRRLDKFHFQSGQYANITILKQGMWYTHPFSFSAAQNEHFIRFSIKSLGDYTSKISSLTPGTRIIIDGPLGFFIDDMAERDKFLFIAGGIGITPIRAMIESLALKKKNVSLLYACKTEPDIIFRKELEDLKKNNPGISLNYILSNSTPGFESGFIDKAKIVKLVPDFFDREVYLCGPPPMMKALNATMQQLGIKSKYIHFEKFSF
ncbi:MAG: ferredoxin reductase family protein [Patescibacteria group bacterium]